MRGVLFPLMNTPNAAEKATIPSGGPTGEDSTSFMLHIADYLLRVPAVERIYDASFTPQVEKIAEQLMSGHFGNEPAKVERVKQQLAQSPLASILVRSTQEQPESRLNLIVQGGYPAREVMPLRKQLIDEQTQKGENFITFTPVTATDSVEVVAGMVRASSNTPILIVELTDHELGRNAGASPALQMLVKVYDQLGREDKLLTTKVYYTFPYAQDSASVLKNLNEIKKLVASKYNVHPGELHLYGEPYSRLAESGLNRGLIVAARPKANPRHRMVRQVAAFGMRTFPFPG